MNPQTRFKRLESQARYAKPPKYAECRTVFDTSRNELPFQRRTSQHANTLLFLETTITITTPTYPLSRRIEHMGLLYTLTKQTTRISRENVDNLSAYERYSSPRMNLPLSPSRTVNVAFWYYEQTPVCTKLCDIVPIQRFHGVVVST